MATGARLETYVIPAKTKGEISLNGAAARSAAVGDKVIILTYAALSAQEISSHQARIVILGAGNKVLSSRAESPSR
jgi:aspartate 1-decarboxylase